MLLDPASVVALAQVGQFVGDNGRVLGFVPGVQEQAEVDSDDSPRDREGVDLRAVDQHGGECGLGQIGFLGEPEDVQAHVILEDRVVDGRRAGADLHQG